jgi:hypothetical protein
VFFNVLLVTHGISFHNTYMLNILLILLCEMGILYVCQNVCCFWNSILQAEVTLYFKSVFMGFYVKVTEI